MFVVAGWFHPVGQWLAPAAGRGLRLHRNAPGNAPCTARRHTQVPPYIYRRTADMGRRTYVSRRRAALPSTTGVGAGIPDGPGWGAVWARQGCRALRWGVQKGRRPTTRDGVGTAALRLTPWGLRHLRMALWDDWVFRAVRGAGISLAAASGYFAPCEARPKALPLETAIF